MQEINCQNEKITFPIAIVVARFNQSITSELLAGAKQRLLKFGFSEADMTVVYVPGAVEIPLVAQRLARLKKYSAIITLGAVIQGDTKHFDYVCEQASQGCAQVMLEHDLPVLFGVLTTNNLKEAEERIGGAHGHKGVDVAEAAVEMVALLKRI